MIWDHLVRAACVFLLVVGFIILGIGLADVAGATGQDDCKRYTDHSGHLPEQYDYGIFIEDDIEVVSDRSEDPQDYGAGDRWDTVFKCKIVESSTTTTTEPPETTTTLPPTTTTTEPNETTTTTIPEETTTSSPPDTTTTTRPVPPTSEVDPPEELPYTGPSAAGLSLLGFSLLVTGGLLLRRGE